MCLCSYLKQQCMDSLQTVMKHITSLQWRTVQHHSVQTWAIKKESTTLERTLICSQAVICLAHKNLWANVMSQISLLGQLCSSLYIMHYLVWSEGCMCEQRICIINQGQSSNLGRGSQVFFLAILFPIYIYMHVLHDSIQSISLSVVCTM